MKPIGQMLRDAQDSAYKQSKSYNIDGQRVEGNPVISYGILSHAVAEVLESHLFCQERWTPKFCGECGQAIEAPAMPGENPCRKCGKPTVHDPSDVSSQLEDLKLKIVLDTKLITAMRDLVDIIATKHDEGGLPSLDTYAACKLARIRADELLKDRPEV